MVKADELEDYIKKYANEPRTALVIGNANYKIFKKLKNPIKDAEDMRVLLKKLGFNVLFITDADKKRIKEAIRTFYSHIKKGGVGLFYYAGQGIEVDYKNYLIPVEADIQEIEDIDSEAVHLSDITIRMTKARNRANIIILDSSRSNPFFRGGRDGMVGIKNTKGIYIAYASQPGKPAVEGIGKRNGLFTTYLKKFLPMRGLSIDQVFNKVRKEVHKKSNGRQIPYTSSGMLSPFYFALPKRKEFNIANNEFNIPMTPIEVLDRPRRRSKTKKYKLKITTVPKKTFIQFTGSNAPAFYHDDIKLPKGKYSVKISKDGYLSKTGSFVLDKNTEFKARLEKLEDFSDVDPIKVAQISKRRDRNIKNSKKVWLDGSTGLMWERKTKRNQNFDVIWRDAEKYCRTLKISNFRDWRLPSIEELSTILTSKKYNGKHIKKELSKRIGKWGWYWTSTHANKEEIQLIYFNEGITSIYHKSVKYYVRCVREPKY